MAKGVLVVLLCPMMDEQLFYSLKAETDPYRLVLLTNSVSTKTATRMQQRGIKFETFPEQAFLNGHLETDPSQFTVVIRVNSLGLHAYPDKLKATIESEIEEMQDRMDALAVYYGTCGNAIWDVSKWCKEKGYKPTVVLRNEDDGNVVDDCVGVWIGNDHTYHDLVLKYTGILFVTPSIADNWEEFMLAGDSGKALRSMDPEMKEMLGITDANSLFRWTFEVAGYQYALKIKTGYELDPAAFDKSFNALSKSVNLKPITIEDGWVSIHPADVIYKGAKALLGDD